MAIYSYEIGATAITMQNIEDLGVAAVSVSKYTPYSVVSTAADGTSVGDGFPEAEWPFTYLTQTMFNILCAYVSGYSSVIYINTKQYDGTYDTFSAIMHLPTGTHVMGGGYRDVKVRFTHLETA